MPKGTTRPHGSSGETISHFNMVRLRVNGRGALKLKLLSMQDVQQQQLPDMQMADVNHKQPRVLANFKQQRAKLEIGTVSINDYFKINRIIIFSRFFASEFPG